MRNLATEATGVRVLPIQAFAGGGCRIPRRPDCVGPPRNDTRSAWTPMPLRPSLNASAGGSLGWCFRRSLKGREPSPGTPADPPPAPSSSRSWFPSALDPYPLSIAVFSCVPSPPPCGGGEAATRMVAKGRGEGWSRQRRSLTPPSPGGRGDAKATCAHDWGRVSLRRP